MKKQGSLKIALSVLVIVLIALISFGGIYVKDKNVMKNILPDYEYGMELEDINIIKMELKKDDKKQDSKDEDKASDENEENNTSAESEETENNNETNETSQNSETSNETNEVTEDNKTENETEEQKQEEKSKEEIKSYKKAKSIIEKRLAMAKVEQYTIRLDEQTGNMVIELPNDVASGVAQSIFNKGKFEIEISDNNEIIATNNSVEKVETSIDDSYVAYGQGSIVKMNIVFNKEATKKYEEIKNTYDMTIIKEEKVSDEKDSDEIDEENVEEEADEDAETETTVEDREIKLTIDGTSLCTLKLTEFLESAVNGSLPLTIGGYTTDESSLESSLVQANLNKSIIQNEELPVEYSLSFIAGTHSEINKKTIVLIFAIVLVLMLIYMLVKYKANGLHGMLTIIGILGTVLLTIRFSSLKITISTLSAIMVITVLQFAFIIKVLNNKITSKKFNETIIEFTKILIPVLIMSLIISFAKILELSTIGQVIFWGLIVFELFNNIITRAILTNVKNK